MNRIGLPLWLILIAILAGATTFHSKAAQPSETFFIWPGMKAPDDDRNVGKEHVLEGRRRPFYQLTDISLPTLDVFLPPADQRTGAAVLVCPGGGLQRLAYEHEGLEVADWLAGQGIAAFVLKYRVPAPVKMGLADAQRAMGIIRLRAEEWGIDPASVGILGFSAGGEIAAWLGTHHRERVYEARDAADELSCRPDFAGLVYPGGLLQWRTSDIKSDILENIDDATPPMFFAHAFNDGCQNSLAMALALKQKRVPAEVHIYGGGAHGFGARTTGDASHEWKTSFVNWMRAQGHLDPMGVRKWAAAAIEGIQTGGAIPAMENFVFNPGVRHGFLAQKRVVEALTADDRIGGYKGAMASAAAQSSRGLDGPLTGVLYRSGRLSAEDKPTVSSPAGTQVMVETEIGYIVSVDINYEILNDAQASGAVKGVVPVIELPVGYGDRAKGSTLAGVIGMNIGSSRFIVGEEQPLEGFDPDAVKIRLERDGAELHATTGAEAAGGQWHNLRKIINQLVSNGHTLRAGQIVISGALGVVQTGEPGSYKGDFGTLGVIEFEIE